MRINQIKLTIDILKNLLALDEDIKSDIEKNDVDAVRLKLTDCQSIAIEIGEFIDSVEGEGSTSVHYLEEYCEHIFETYNSVENGTLTINAVKKLNKTVNKAINSVKYDTNINKIAVFLPYKASMWDSLESVYLSAKNDPYTQTIVAPIPYYDKDAAGNFTDFHYEGELFPDNIPITHYQDLKLNELMPDMIFIHYPYDGGNLITSIHPDYYSKNLKKFTPNLIYIPYYATTGGMSEGQAMCMAYIFADYIVTQSPKYRDFFDEMIPNRKFLAFGSPKFDSIINKCKNPPQIPLEWQKHMNGKKVYFFNTSLGGMMGNTKNYLKKMEYVFETFKRHPEVCLLWRPHPLLEHCFETTKPEYLSEYRRIRTHYIDERIGIYDTTPLIEDAIALSDVYIGDAGTSVTSLFGVVGKPMFILDNDIHDGPRDENVIGSVRTRYRTDTDNEYIVSEGNRLFVADADGNYRFVRRLSEFSAGGYYVGVMKYENKLVILPCSAQNILILDSTNIMGSVQKLEFIRKTEKARAFHDYVIYKNYIFLIPNEYPDMVRVNLNTWEIDYIENISKFMNFGDARQYVPAAHFLYDGIFYMFDCSGSKMLRITADSLEKEKIDTPLSGRFNFAACRTESSDAIYLLSYDAPILVRWNVKTGEVKEFDLNVPGLISIDRHKHTECKEWCFSSLAFDGDNIVICPNWANKFVAVNERTEEIYSLEVPFDISFHEMGGYMKDYCVGVFSWSYEAPSTKLFYHAPVRECYNFNISSDGKSIEFEQMPMNFDIDDVKATSAGFSKASDWLQYCCNEDAYNSLEDLISDNISGQPFDKDKQIEAFMGINASPDGDCGQKVYEFVNKKVLDSI